MNLDNTYSICNRVSGQQLGLYTADSEESAVETMAIDAGYDNAAHMEEVTGEDTADLTVEVVEQEPTISPDRRASFAFAGNATFTLVSVGTRKRFTYQVKASNSRDDFYFVSLLTGPDNDGHFGYIGIVAGDKFRTTAKSTARPGATSVRAFDWWVRHQDSELVELLHAGTCGRCGRTLTVPESIETGLGPVCAAKS